MFIATYKSPIGNLLISSKDNKLVGLWKEGQKYYLSNFKEEMIQSDNNKILVETKR